MNKYLPLIVAITLASISVSSMASHSVRGYTRSNGTYVQPHQSMDPGESRSSGYSYHNNVIVPRNDSNNNHGYGMTSGY